MANNVYPNCLVNQSTLLITSAKNKTALKYL